MNADQLWKRANEIIPGGSQLLSKNRNLFSPEKWPTYYSKAKGVHTWDLNGRKYIDFASNGIGACSLGFGNRHIDRFVKETVNLGVMSSLNAPEEVELAEKLVELHPWADMVRFARTGGKLMQ